MKQSLNSSLSLPVRQSTLVIQADPSWLVVLPIGVWAVATGYVATIGAFLSQTEIWAVTLGIAVLVIFSLLGHILAHAGAAILTRSELPAKIAITPFGDASQSWPAAASPGQEALVATSGPFLNILLAGLAYLAWNAQLNPFLNVSMPFLGIYNLWLAVVNLTPVFPLDGGRLLRVIGWGLLGQSSNIERFGVRLGYLLAAGLCVWGIFLIVQNDRFSWETGGASILYGLLLAEGLKLHPAWTEYRTSFNTTASDRRKHLRPIPNLLASLLALALIIISSTVLMTNNGIETPGVALSVEPMIQIPAQYLHPHNGTFILTSVVEQSPVPAGGWLLSRLTPSVKFLPPEKAVANELSPQQAAEEGYQELYQSESTALAVGLQRAGYPATVTGKGVKVVSIIPESHANGVLKPGDVIIGLNGKPVHLITDLTNALQSMTAGTTIQLLVQRNQQPFEARIQLLEPATPDNPPRVGITIDSAGFAASLPFQAKIVSQKIVGGPSAGLMFTLGVYNAVTPEDLTHGRKIAGTGTINPDGTVGPIGGVEEKVVAAEMAGAEYFLSPPENYAAALSAARRIKVVKIATVDQAIAFLNSLPAQ